ncbi:MAG: ammonium transporter, partial [Thermoplasmata archaeon]
RGLPQSGAPPYRIHPGWLSLAVLLLWVGWFGFNPGSVLQFNDATVTVVLTTFLAASAGLLSLLLLGRVVDRQNPPLLLGANGVLMGLIVITPLAGFVSPGSALLLGLLAGPVFIAGERLFGRFSWISDPIGLMPGHLTGGIFGVAMIAFFTQGAFASAAGFPSLPNGLLFGGGASAVHQMGIELFGVAVVLVVVFALSWGTLALLARLMGGITSPSAAGTAGGPPPSPSRSP